VVVAKAAQQQHYQQQQQRKVMHRRRRPLAKVLTEEEEEEGVQYSKTSRSSYNTTAAINKSNKMRHLVEMEKRGNAVKTVGSLAVGRVLVTQKGALPVLALSGEA